MKPVVSINLCCYNSERYLEETLQSIVSQTYKNWELVIVNDGSTDNTGTIINGYAMKYPWIHAVHISNRGFRKPGGGIIDAFYAGYSSRQTNEWDYIVKLDGDLSFDADYFERCFEYFRSSSEIGVGGGIIYDLQESELILERMPLFHVRGATKIYRKNCWDAIGGLVPDLGWDTLDEVKANMLGWRTRTFSDLKIVQHRTTGGPDGRLKSYAKRGRANYIAGYHPLFMFMKCFKRTTQKPYVIAAAAMTYGFVSGYLNRVPQINDKELIKYLRKQQIRKITFRESIWK